MREKGEETGMIERINNTMNECELMNIKREKERYIVKERVTNGVSKD